MLAAISASPSRLEPAPYLTKNESGMARILGHQLLLPTQLSHARVCCSLGLTSALDQRKAETPPPQSEDT